MASEKLKKKLQKRQKELSQKGGGKIPYFLVKEGTTRIRLLPVGEEEPGQEATFFYINKEIGGIVSPMTFDEPCAIMEAHEKLKKSKDENDRELAKSIQPKKRYFALCYKYKDEKGTQVDHESGVKLVILTSQLYQEIIDLYLDEEQGDMTDPISGYDLKLKRTGTGQFDTEYHATPCKPTKMDMKYRKMTFDPQEELRKVTASFEETEKIVEQVIGVSIKKKKSSSSNLKKKKKKKSRF